MDRNKSKGKKSTQYKTTAEEFKKPKSIIASSRDHRLNRKDQLRKNKISEYVMKKRGLIDSDASDKSLHLTSKLIDRSKNASITNLTGLIDNTIYKVPPKLCALVALNDFVNLDLIMNNMESVIEGSEGVTSKTAWTLLIPPSIFKGKERVTMVKTKREIYSILDICKVADVIIFVSSCKETEYSKWKTDPDKFTNAIDEFGYKILSMLRAQGLPQHICVLQDIDVIPDKHKSDIKKLFSRYFDSELSPNKSFTLNSDKCSEDEYKSLVRHLCSVTPFAVNLDIRKHRSYMMVHQYSLVNGDIQIGGYIRGNTLNLGNYVHLTGLGDYLVTDVMFDRDPCPQTRSESKSGMEIEPTITTGKKLTDIEDGVENTQDNFNSDNKPKVIGVNKSVEKQEGKMNIVEEDIDFDIKIIDDEEDSLSFNDDEEDEGKVSNKHKFKTTLQTRKEEDMEFPDEVDTPYEVNARERFRKYRGLASLKQGSWDPLENLPKEYANIFSFENLRYLYKCAVRKAHEEGMKISGSYVTITLKNFDKEDLKYLREDVPMIMSTLLEHERKLCVMHYKVKLNYEYEGSVRSKMAFETSSGFRRILTKPIFSSEVTGGANDKLKIEKKLLKDRVYIASVYTQLTYSNSPLLFFRPDSGTGILNLVASGEVVESDSKKVILKRIILTGYPLKIKKKKATIRYMFFNPGDVCYFKPIGLVTKNGLRGNITESLGTHGHMKCIFNDFLKASDTVCLNLYKRVFPKWTKESWKYKVFYGNRPDYNRYFLDEPKETEEESAKPQETEMNIDQGL